MEEGLTMLAGKEASHTPKKAKAVSTPQGEKGASNAHFERRRRKKTTKSVFWRSLDQERGIPSSASRLRNSAAVCHFFRRSEGHAVASSPLGLLRGRF